MRYSMLVAVVTALCPTPWSAHAHGAVTVPAAPSWDGDRERRPGGRLWDLLSDGYTIPLGLAVPPVIGSELWVGERVAGRLAADRGE